MINRLPIALDAIFFGVWEIAVASSEHSDEVVEAPLVWVEFSTRPKVPFSDECGVVTQGLELICNCVFRDWEAQELRSSCILSGVLVEVAFISEATRVSPGEQPCS